MSTFLHPAAWDTAKLLAECECRRQRRSGPGGQHRNKVETAVVITHLPTALRGAASERRSQEQNRRQALFRLRVNLAVSVRRPLDAAHRDGPSETWRRHCLGGRLAVRPAHEDFPAMLAEALDVIRACEDEFAAAAAWLGCTASQLTRLLKLEPRALERVNQDRRQRGLRPLR
jgi:hypothetical protein